MSLQTKSKSVFGTSRTDMNRRTKTEMMMIMIDDASDNDDDRRTFS